MFNNISFKPCKNNVGALIELDLNNINDSQIKAIKHILDDFGVIFFRKQNLT